MVEQIARLIDPSSWRVLDYYLADVKRKYARTNSSYDPDAFKDKASMKTARDILRLAQPQPTSDGGLAEALTEVLDQIEDAEQHGGGAHDDGCSICIAMQDARAALEALAARGSKP